MDTNIAQKIARAFVHGLAFAKGMTTLAQDAKAKMEEGDKWGTIGAEPGDDGKKHGGRHVLISGTGEVKAGLSKSAQGKPLGEAVKELKDKAESKKAEGKKAEKENLSFREMARRHSEQKAKEAGRSVEEKDKTAQLSHQLNMKLFSYYDSVREATEDIERSVAEQLQLLDNSGKRAKDDLLMSALHGIDSAARTSQMFLRDYYRRVVAAAEKGKIDSTRAAKELDAFKNLADETQSLTSRMKAQISHIDDPRYNKRGDRTKIANEMRRIAKKTEEDIHNSIRNRVQDLEKAESAPETHTYSAKELDSMKQKHEGRVEAKKQNAELNRKFKEGVESGNIRFPRNEFRERAKAYTEQANQVINDDLKPSVDKLGSAIRKNTDNARMPQSTLDDLNDIHNLAKQIGPMASKLNKYNEKYAAEHDDPSNYVISNYGAATKGTAETVASLARRAAAMSNQLTAPDDERDYSEGRAKQEIRDILDEMRGLHGDLLKKTRHAATAFNTSKPSSSESDRVDAMYAQKGSKPKQRIIN